MPSDPLSELLAHLERGGTVPLAWVVAHAPDGEPRRLWEGARDPALLLQLSVAAERRRLVQASCACARTARPFAGIHREAAEDAITLAEAWTRGVDVASSLGNVAARTQVLASHLANEVARARAGGAQGAEAEAVAAACNAADAFHEPLAAAFAGSAALAACALMGHDYEAVRVRLAAIVRTHLPCPTLDQLRAAFQRG